MQTAQWVRTIFVRVFSSLIFLCIQFVYYIYNNNARETPAN